MGEWREEREGGDEERGEGEEEEAMSEEVGSKEQNHPC